MCAMNNDDIVFTTQDNINIHFPCNIYIRYVYRIVSNSSISVLPFELYVYDILQRSRTGN